MRSPTRYKFRHYRTDEDGIRKLIWASDGPGRSEELDVVQGSELDLEVVNSQLWTPNALANEGEVDILDVYFDVQAVRTNFYIGLLSVAPSETTTCSTMTELAVASGYAREVVARGSAWTAPAHDTGTTSDTVTFTATGTWTTATDCFLTTEASATTGPFIAWADLSADRTLLNTDTLDVDITVSLE